MLEDSANIGPKTRKQCYEISVTMPVKIVHKGRSVGPYRLSEITTRSLCIDPPFASSC
jgi:hypothetical protein